MTKEQATKRLEELRKELRNATISCGELAELQELAPYIDPGDTELLEAAGVPEFPENKIYSTDDQIDKTFILNEADDMALILEAVKGIDEDERETLEQARSILVGIAIELK